MTKHEETKQLVGQLIDLLVERESYPYATGFIGSMLMSLLSGEKTPEQEIEFINEYIKESEANNG